MGTIKSWVDPAIEKLWRENRGLSEAAVVMYRERVQQFVDYCVTNGLSEKAELTLAGVERFSRWRSRRYRGQLRHCFPLARSALGTWAFARRMLGEELPAWKPEPDASRNWPPLVHEFAEHVRRHRGNPPNTIRKKAAHVTKFLAFLRTRRRRPCSFGLTDIDAFVVCLRL